MTASILLVSGPVGAGKTTDAKLVVQRWGSPVAYLEGDEFWKFFAHRAPAESPDLAMRRDAKILVQALIASAARFARGGYDVVADFTLAPWALDSIVSSLNDIPVELVAICPSLAACSERIVQRDKTDYAAYADLHGAFAKLGSFERHAIRDDRATPDDLAARILERRVAGELRMD